MKCLHVLSSAAPMVDADVGQIPQKKHAALMYKYETRITIISNLHRGKKEVTLRAGRMSSLTLE